MKPSNSGLFFAGVFKLLIQFHDWVWWVHILCFILIWSWKTKFLGIHPFLLGFSFYWRIIVKLIPFDPLYFCGAGFNFPLIFFYFIGLAKKFFWIFSRTVYAKIWTFWPTNGSSKLFCSLTPPCIPTWTSTDLLSVTYSLVWFF